jgi:HAMP domain-containing protein/DNA-binding transcriptional ArsR family regulator
MNDARSFAPPLLILLVPAGVYLLRCIYVSYFSLIFNWTESRGPWTKPLQRLADKRIEACERCKEVFAIARRSALGAATGISDAYRGRLLPAVGERCSALGESAISCIRRTRRRGRARVPEDAAIGRTQLKHTQERALAALTTAGSKQLSRGEYEKLTGVSRSQAAYDLAELVEAGILRRVGAGRATRYRLAREGGGHRHWTNDRIHTELKAFCAGRQTWPSAAAFKASGRGDLYVAASRYGGIRHWAEALGYPRPGRVPTPEPQSPSLRGKLAWAAAGTLAAAAGALAAIGLVAAGVVVLVSLTRGSDPIATLSSAVSRGAPAGHVNAEPAHPLRPSAIRTQKPQAVARRKRQHVAKRRAPTPRTHTPSAASLVTYSAPQTTHAAARMTDSSPQHAAAPSSSGTNGPAPLAAPPSGGAPQPIPAPHK